jgi:hypothetical protein
MHKTTNECTSRILIEEYGWDNIVFTVLEECTAERRKECEQYWIDFVPNTVNVYRAFTTEEERNGRNKAYYEVNREAILKQVKTYNEVNRDAINEQKRVHYEVNKEALLEKAKIYREANRDAINERNRAYREANREAINEKKKAYYAAKKTAT